EERSLACATRGSDATLGHRVGKLLHQHHRRPFVAARFRDIDLRQADEVIADGLVIAIAAERTLGGSKTTRLGDGEGHAKSWTGLCALACLIAETAPPLEAVGNA